MDARPNHAGRVARMRPTCAVLFWEKRFVRDTLLSRFFSTSHAPVTGPGYWQGWSGVRPKAVWRVLREHLQQGLPGWPGCVMPCGLLNCSCGLVVTSILSLCWRQLPRIQMLLATHSHSHHAFFRLFIQTNFDSIPRSLVLSYTLLTFRLQQLTLITNNSTLPSRTRSSITTTTITNSHLTSTLNKQQATSN